MDCENAETHENGTKSIVHFFFDSKPMSMKLFTSKCHQIMNSSICAYLQLTKKNIFNLK